MGMGDLDPATGAVTNILENQEADYVRNNYGAILGEDKIWVSDPLWSGSIKEYDIETLDLLTSYSINPSRWPSVIANLPSVPGKILTQYQAGTYYDRRGELDLSTGGYSYIGPSGWYLDTQTAIAACGHTDARVIQLAGPYGATEKYQCTFYFTPWDDSEDLKYWGITGWNYPSNLYYTEPEGTKFYPYLENGINSIFSEDFVPHLAVNPVTGRIYKSWIEVGRDPSYLNAYKVAQYWAYSDDVGETWKGTTNLGYITSDLVPEFIVPGPDGSLYRHTARGPIYIYRSADGGDTWSVYGSDSGLGSGVGPTSLWIDWLTGRFYYARYSHRDIRFNYGPSGGSDFYSRPTQTIVEAPDLWYPTAFGAGRLPDGKFVAFWRDWRDGFQVCYSSSEESGEWQVGP